MVYTINQDKMMYAVLMDERLMEIGGYSADDIPENIYTAMSSDNCVINAVATIITRKADGANNKEIYNQINQYLRTNL